MIKCFEVHCLTQIYFHFAWLFAYFLVTIMCEHMGLRNGAGRHLIIYEKKNLNIEDSVRVALYISFCFCQFPIDRVKTTKRKNKQTFSIN